MPNPTVPKRASQIPRSLPAGVGGGDGFGHHPKPISGGMNDPRPSDFPMNQKRYRGPAGGQSQWDSKTETPVWREIPRDKNLPKRQYSPSPREQFPNTYKKSRYKPGTLRIPTQNPPIKPVVRPVKKPSNWIKKGITGGFKDFIIDEALKPAGGSDGTIPSFAFPGLPPPPPSPIPPRPPSICGQKLDRVQWGAKKGDRLEVFEYGVYLKTSYGGVLGTAGYKEPDQGVVQFVKINGKWVGGRPWAVNDVTVAASKRFSVYYEYYDLIKGGVEKVLYGWVYRMQVRPKTYLNKRGWVYGDVREPDESVKTGTGKGIPKKQFNYSDHIRTWLAQDHGAVPIYEPPLTVSNMVARYSFATYGLICSNTDFEDGIDEENYEPLDDYDFDVDEDTEMGCKWQKDEVGYQLPELKIGENTIGGNSIQIDDGLIPLADFLVKAVEMMHRGLGLQNLDITEFDKVLGDPGKGKLKPASLSELVHWQFENVSNLVGLPSSQAITTLDNQTKDFAFRNVQDALTFLYQQQKESDMDLKIIETYHAKTAQQLEAVTQIALRQTADLEMIVQELGIKWKWERKERPSLYKHGMSDDDETTGILELFKGGTVAYPVRVWNDEVDSRQIALRTNLYAEMAAQSTLTRINSSEGIPGLDARSRMKSGDDESWKEWVKAINSPEKGTVSGVATPYIEEYEKGSLQAKNIAAPTSALSVFMKPKKSPKK
jgi:hypothetical protein